MFRPADRADLMAFLRDKPDDVPVTVIGVGSNLLVRDGGVPGVVVRLGRGFVDIEAEGQDIVCGAGALDVHVATVARNHGIAGLEFLSGIPGTIGGALRMNAGAYGRETKDVLVEATAIDPHGTEHTLKPDDLGMAYRRSSLPCDWIFVGARLRGAPGDPGEIGQRMTEIQAARSGSQPIRSRTGGSTFKNPPGHKAWELIDKAGCRGLRRGAAMVSEQHCNFLINTGGASATDLEFLGEEIRTRVYQASGIRLEWEIRRIGLPDVPRDWGGNV
jgi:UDP-N-acetylmuramate dehydrogenase